MFEPKDLKYDVTGTIGSPPYKLCYTEPSYAYINGIKTSNQDGTLYTVQCDERHGKRLKVKVLGSQDVSLEKHLCKLVNFEGLELYRYVQNEKDYVRARAKKIYEV